MFQGKKIIDLTHTLHADMPTWGGGCGFSSTIKMDYPDGLRAQSLRLHAGIGTHMDAPAHFKKGGTDVSEIPLEELMLPLVTIDLSKKAHADYVITVEDLKEFDKNHPIPKGSFVACATGWSRFIHDPKAYRHVGVDGAMHFPTYSAEAAAYLLDKGVMGIGIDTLSPDLDDAFPVHHCILGAGHYILENMANLERLPPLSFMINLPLKMAGLTESPVRAIAIV